VSVSVVLLADVVWFTVSFWSRETGKHRVCGTYQWRFFRKWWWGCPVPWNW